MFKYIGDGACVDAASNAKCVRIVRVPSQPTSFGVFASSWCI